MFEKKKRCLMFILIPKCNCSSIKPNKYCLSIWTCQFTEQVKVDCICDDLLKQNLKYWDNKITSLQHSKIVNENYLASEQLMQIISQLIFPKWLRGKKQRKKASSLCTKYTESKQRNCVYSTYVTHQHKPVFSQHTSRMMENKGKKLLKVPNN